MCKYKCKPKLHLVTHYNLRGNVFSYRERTFALGESTQEKSPPSPDFDSQPATTGPRPPSAAAIVGSFALSAKVSGTFPPGTKARSLHGRLSPKLN